MLQNQLARGNNGLIKTKYLTFSIEADSIRSAKPRLERIETDVLNNFKRLGVAAEVLDGKARLAQLHAIFHMDEQAPFQFEWDWLAPSGLSTKDFIAPSGFEFRTGKQFRMGKKYGAVSFVQILAPELNDRMLADFLDMESSLIVNLHIQSVDQVKAIKTVKRKITDLDRSKIEEQKKAVRAGYDMDIIPSRPCHLRGRGQEAVAGPAKPQRADVPGDVPGAEHRRQSPPAGQQHLPGQLHRAKVQLPADPAGLPAGGRLDVLSAAGAEPGGNSAGG